MLSFINSISRWAIPLLLLAIPTIGIIRKVPIYESFVAGAKEGYNTSVRILPYLVAMLIAIQIFRQSGAMDKLIMFMAPLTQKLGVPNEVLPLAIIRPLSGSGALAMLSYILGTYGPDSFIGRLASTIQGCTETTFYVITVYFGSVGIKKIRHSLITCLAADIVGFIVSVLIVAKIFG